MVVGDVVGDGVPVGRESGGESGVLEELAVDGCGETGVSWGCVEDREMGGDGSVEGGRLIQDKLVRCNGKVEGKSVNDIVLDTGCACTMVRHDLVLEDRVVARATIRLRCAHGALSK